MKKLTDIALSALLLSFPTTALLLSSPMAAYAYGEGDGWPSNYEGVMMQGFYWDSYKGTNTCRWTDLTRQADELSKSFSLIWIPNAAKASGEDGGGNGYVPIYWFSNYNCAYGTEEELSTMISTFKAKGTGILEDVVLNHRVGVSDWADFPAETWNGVTYQLYGSDVCSTDEWDGDKSWTADEGQDFDGGRDLDHTSSNVQTNCKAYTRFLLEEKGFAGFRYDMVKGYAGYYTGMYNQESQPRFSVGEYFDSSYDLVAQWIENTGKRSAAFDFPCKYALNRAFDNNNMKELVWYANGENPQPAGMIHWWYPRYSVTFVDNHDTDRDGSKFNHPDKVEAANAFIICSPGTPCVFYGHWINHSAAIKKMIEARNSVGVHNQSAVRVLQTDESCYMAEVDGTRGKLVVKIGPAMVSPAGYSNDQIVASGEDYCIWTSTAGATPTSVPSSLYIIGEVNGNTWAYNKGVKMTRSGNKYSATVTIDASSRAQYFSFAASLSSSWDGLNASGNRYTPTTDTQLTESGVTFRACTDGNNAKAFYIPTSGTYTITADFDTLKAYISGSGDDQQVSPSTADYYLIGHFPDAAFQPGSQVRMEKSGDEYSVTQDLVSAGDGAPGYFSIVTSDAESWDGADGVAGINSSDRYGAPAADTAATIGEAMTVKKFAAGVNASSAYSWSAAAGKYSFTFNPRMMTLTLNPISGVGAVEGDTEASERWFNMQGMEIGRPSQRGVYVRLKGGKATKVMR